MGKTTLERLREQRKAKRDALNDILGDETRSELSAEEDTKVGGLLTEIAALDERISDLADLESREAAGDKARADLGNADTRTESVSVGDEPRVYTADSGNQWINDNYRANFCGDASARQRLERYAKENEVHKRDVGTGAFGALIPPQYLLDQFAELLRAGRPVANAVTRLPLPAVGMSMTVPRGTAGTLTDVQTAELTDVAESDFDETPLTVPVITVAGQQDVSRQALERGQGIDTILFADLASDFSVKVDREVISGTGVGGHAVGILNTGGINAVTYTDATPTVGELYPKLADAVQRVVTGRYLPPTAIIMHPRRWAMLTASVDTTGRPIFGINGTGPSQNATGVGDAARYGQVVGNMLGLPVITDANIGTLAGAGTNEDTIIIARLPDLLLWEQNGGAPRELRFEETNASKLAVKLVVYGYMAFTAARYPTSISTITGTGLVTPTF